MTHLCLFLSTHSEGMSQIKTFQLHWVYGSLSECNVTHVNFIFSKSNCTHISLGTSCTFQANLHLRIYLSSQNVYKSIDTWIIPPNCILRALIWTKKLLWRHFSLSLATLGSVFPSCARGSSPGSRCRPSFPSMWLIASSMSNWIPFSRYGVLNNCT